MKEVAHGIPMTPQPAPVRPDQERTGGGLILAMLIAFCAIGIHSDAHAAQSAATDELLSAVIASLEQGQPELRTGRGSALVTENCDGEMVRSVVQFAFKGDSSRSDVHADQDGAPGEFQTSWARNEHATVSFNAQHSALIQPQSRISGLFEANHNEFSPEACAFLPCGTVVSALQFMAAQPTTIARLDEHGFLHVEYTLPEESGGAGFARLVLDSNKGYRVIEYSDVTRNLNGEGSEDEISYVLSWKEYDGFFYIDSVAYRMRGWTVQELGEPCEPFESIFEKTVQIQDFSPDVAIDDQEFTLQGMGLTGGTRIADNIVGIVYVYGDDPALEFDLKLAVDEGLAQVGMEMPGGSASDGMGTGEAQASPASGASSGSHAAPWSLLAMAGAGVAIVLGVLWRLRTRRRDA